MTPGEEQEWCSEQVRHAYEEHSVGVRLFLVGVLRDSSLADDILQVVFAKLLTHGQRVRRETVRGWLFQVAWNEVQLHRRREAGRSRVERTLEWIPKVESGDPLQEILKRESIEEVRKGIAALPEEQRLILEGRLRDGKTFSVLAEELGLPTGTVVSRLHSAFKRLKEYLS